MGIDVSKAILDVHGRPESAAPCVPTTPAGVRRLAQHRLDVGRPTVPEPRPEYPRRLPSQEAPLIEQLAAYLGFVPREASSGDRERKGAITKAGNAHCRNAHLRHVLIQAAWSYRYVPKVAAHVQQRQQGQPPGVIAHPWKAQQRLHKRHVHLAYRKQPQVAEVAVARELIGFLWAAMQDLDPRRVRTSRRSPPNGNPEWRVVGGTHQSDPGRRDAVRRPDTAGNISAPKDVGARDASNSWGSGSRADPRIAAGFTVATAPAHATRLLSVPRTTNDSHITA